MAGFLRRGSKLRHLRSAYRSGLEATIAAALATAGVPAVFEGVKIPFVQPEKSRTYLADFLLPNGILIESKGMFTVEDRQKHGWIKEQHPELDLRFVFSNAKAKLSKGSPTTYAMWAEKNGYKWAHKEVPKEWMAEPVKAGRLAAAKKFLIK